MGDKDRAPQVGQTAAERSALTVELHAGGVVVGSPRTVRSPALERSSESRSSLAILRSAVSKPSVNQP